MTIIDNIAARNSSQLLIVLSIFTKEINNKDLKDKILLRVY